MALVVVAYIVGLVAVGVLLWSAKPGSQRARLAKRVLVIGSIAYWPFLALAVWPNLPFVILLLVAFALELWLNFNSGSRKREAWLEDHFATVDADRAERLARDERERKARYQQELADIDRAEAAAKTSIPSPSAPPEESI
jgi:hypothetical protein